jgi:hypothetical protein
MNATARKPLAMGGRANGMFGVEQQLWLALIVDA